MHRALVLSLLVTISSLPAQTEVDPAEALPSIARDAGVPPPASVLGFDVGRWHVRPDQIVDYFRTLADASPRVALIEYGRTHEDRPLVIAIVSTPENLQRLGEIREKHLATLEEDSAEEYDGPAFAWLGYSVHGNESSAANASLLVAYHLASGLGPEVEGLLEETVVLIDPCLNPDGLARFAGWANRHRGRTLVGDPSHREHREVWPGGRTNHYWFDLNRDWLLAVHPESRGRLEIFRRFHPHVLGDFHEMGTRSTYFFQPGVPSRQNPLTPAENLELTRKVAGFHARALDREGLLYFTEETFDDFYIGKGSTYPDVNGTIGILYEQASSRGHLQESPFGPLAFGFTIANQVRTSLSTLKAVQSLREELIAYQRTFFESAREESRHDPIRAYLVGEPHDPVRLHRFLETLLEHSIEVHRLARSIQIGGRTFEPEWSFVVPTQQSQYRMVTALFEQRTQFLDRTFYDVSAWTLPLSFDLLFEPIDRERFDPGLLGESIDQAPFPSRESPAGETPYAYLFEWTGTFAPRALGRLLAGKIRARVATRPFTATTDRGERRYTRGTIVIPTGIQENPDTLPALLETIARDDGIEIHAVTTGLTSKGIDLGSPSIETLEMPKPCLIVGSGVSAGEAGQVWHLLDLLYGLPLTLLEQSALLGTDLDRYTHLILVSGSTSTLTDPSAEKMRRWVRAGGVLLSIRGSIDWVDRQILERPESEEDDDEKPEADSTAEEAPDGETEPDEGEKRLPYEEYERRRNLERISGAILEARIDITHPIGFGYQRPMVPVFRNHTNVHPLEENPFANVVVYAEEPLLAGHASPRNVRRIAGTASVTAIRSGSGTVIRYADDPAFRGIWYGTCRMLANGIFFGRIIERTQRVPTNDR